MKICKKCKIEKSTSDFYKAKSNKDGLNSLCKKCYYKKNKKYVQENREKVNKSKREWKSKNKESTKLSFKKWYEKNTKDENGYYSVKKEEIKERRKIASSKYIKKNREKLTAKEAMRRASKIQATPEWCECEKIEILYKKCKELSKLTGLKYHVDHIIPLNHSKVCGLHVWENLQILEESLNFKKNNKLGEFLCL